MKHPVYTECLISSKSLDKSVIWQNTEKCKEWKVVQNHMFTVSGVEFFYLGRAVTLSTVKIYGDVPAPWQWKGVFP
jgi:hypothetical protein